MPCRCRNAAMLLHSSAACPTFTSGNILHMLDTHTEFSMIALHMLQNTYAVSRGEHWQPVHNIKVFTFSSFFTHDAADVNSARSVNTSQRLHQTRCDAAAQQRGLRHLHVRQQPAHVETTYRCSSCNLTTGSLYTSPGWLFKWCSRSGVVSARSVTHHDSCMLAAS
jgi:hypothetical protein